MDEPDSVPAVGKPAEPDPAPEPISIETAASWLAAARPASVLVLLRDPDFALISMKAFAGFRVNPSGYGLPLVRKRLAQEILQNDKFADKVRALAEQSTPAPRPEGDGREEGDSSGARHPHPPEPESRSEGPSRREQMLKEERDRRRLERDEARAALNRAVEERAVAEAARAASEGARTEQAKVVQQQAQRIIRLERQVARMQAEQGQMLRALRQDKLPRPPHSPASLIASGSPPADPEVDATVWREAVSHLLDKNRHDTALSLAMDVLRAEPQNLDALDMAARVWEHKGLQRETAETVRRIFSIRSARAEIGPASEALMRLLLVLPDPADATRDVRQWLPLLKTTEAVTAGRVVVERLRGQSPTAFAWLEGQVRASLPALAEELMPPPGALGPDDPLPLPGAWSARRLAEAVNANREEVVTVAREAIARLDAHTSGRVWAVLTHVVDNDDSVLSPLKRAPRGPAVVDGSNAAWFDQHSYAAPRARLRPILELRRALRRRGYFPVLLYADAPLPYTVDDAQTLRTLLGRQEITLVDSGVDADEVLLREAKRYDAPLVTNDYMSDWDPQNEVEKIQFTISLTGEAHLL